MQSLKSFIHEHLRHFHKKQAFIKKSLCFSLKVALFVENRKNKFAYEFK